MGDPVCNLFFITYYFNHELITEIARETSRVLPEALLVTVYPTDFEAVVPSISIGVPSVISFGVLDTECIVPTSTPPTLTVTEHVPDVRRRATPSMRIFCFQIRVMSVDALATVTIVLYRVSVDKTVGSCVNGSRPVLSNWATPFAAPFWVTGMTEDKSTLEYSSAVPVAFTRTN